MHTYLTEVLDEKAIPLLQELESQHIIRLISQEQKPAERLSEQFRGSIPEDIGVDLHRQLDQMRKEW